jgi:hypothetical protein
LTLIVFGSILIGTPFKEAYSREQVPTQMWNGSGFHAFNRKISGSFGVAFLVGTISMIAAGSIDSLQFVLRLVVPSGALLLAPLYTKKQASLATGEMFAR